jgi:phage tail sheath protein FI
MAITYTTPGVYVEEISTLPRSVAEVSTAIPAFLGYSTKGDKFTPTRIETMMEYEQTFGGPPDALEQVAVKQVGGTPGDPAGIFDVNTVTAKADIPLLYYSLRLYFDNGGGPCYIVRLVGDNDSEKPALNDFQSGLDALTKEDEPTLIVMPDATRLDGDVFNTACEKALKHCGEMKNRFAILDVKQAKAKPEEDVAAFRGLASEQQSYGAAYTPYLRTALAFNYDEKKVTVSDLPITFEATLGEIADAIVVAYVAPKSAQPKVEIAQGASTGEIKIEVQSPPDPKLLNPKLTITLNGQDRTAGQVLTAWEKLSDGDKKGFQLRATKIDAKVSVAAEKALDPLTTFAVTVGEFVVTYDGQKTAQPKVEIAQGTSTGEIKIEVQNSTSPKLTITLNGQNRTAGQVLTVWEKLTPGDKKGFHLRTANKDATVSVAAETTLKSPPTLHAVKSLHTGLYNQVKAFLAKQRVTLPPSGAVAGIYARVDRDRGVWKAPANVAVTSVIDLTRTFTDAQQGALNVDPTGGKSINVIRSFIGRGTLVWGARTLAGNDNEWRYIPVRRLFITIEESTKKASAFSVFEPNDATTWLKVRAMIESYLYGLWERGALAGSTPEAAYFVNVGLGKTMTPQDVLEGRMIVEIGVAAVRPSEFIILRFTHQLQAA